MGTALLETLASVFKTQSSSPTPRRIILGGHDRGARICHRLAVDFSHPPSSETASSPLYETLNLTVLGTVILDIIPTSAQWAAFANPAVCRGYFHWPLLANPEVATQMITAFGGGNWARAAHTRIAGPNPLSQERIFSNGAVDVYAELFDTRDTIYYTSLDYAHGSVPESTEQDEDLKAGRKVAVPALVMFSKANLGARIDVPAIWADWIARGIDHEIVGVGEGYGHYLPEEAYDIVIPKIEAFLKKVA